MAGEISFSLALVAIVHIINVQIQELALVDRRQMTLMLSDKEMTLLDQLSRSRGMSKTALVRQALRLYQSVTERLENGEKVFVEKPATKEKTELMVL